MPDKVNLTLRAALRVLTAITEGLEPSRADTETIRRLFPTRSSDPLDELACAVVRMAVKCETASVGGRTNRHAS